ncbi:MBL fold metallo-hydrolase [Knoellia koreensis]|uniref:MBL fold metallo-hydrolase n=1 Tax=Knoellia koreensis TaxID=2730921 RepID=A0A849HDA0_9MICO|nr:MBL fold metallo-hydrolase [Knoellia sp. DB2414S]NNM44634.1 MBL fold metallo-hydrolase [Knoellia sp. DB2414S]
MRITHLGHASLLVEVADRRILIDPGVWSPEAHSQRDLSAILVTHQHPDHLDQDLLPELMSANPEVRVITDPETAELLQEKGIDVTALAGDDSVRLGEVTVTGVGKMHALINEDIPRIHNTGMRISADGEPTLFHTGDALDGDPGDIDIVAFALNAPWAASRDMTGFLRDLAAPIAIPVHDALLSETGRGLYLDQARGLGSQDTEIRDLSDGQPQEFTAR